MDEVGTCRNITHTDTLHTVINAHKLGLNQFKFKNYVIFLCRFLIMSFIDILQYKIKERRMLQIQIKKAVIAIPFEPKKEQRKRKQFPTANKANLKWKLSTNPLSQRGMCQNLLNISVSSN